MPNKLFCAAHSRNSCFYSNINGENRALKPKKASGKFCLSLLQTVHEVSQTFRKRQRFSFPGCFFFFISTLFYFLYQDEVKFKRICFCDVFKCFGMIKLFICSFLTAPDVFQAVPESEVPEILWDKRSCFLRQWFRLRK